MATPSVLRDRIELQSKVAGQQDSFGGAPAAPTYATYDTVWAQVEDLSGRELERAKSFGASVSIKITIRYNVDLSTHDRIKLGSRYLLVNAVLRDGYQNMYSNVFCSEFID